MPDFVPLLDPQFWRDRAEEARTHADRTQDQKMKALWLRIAEGHERQATLVTQIHDLERRQATDKPPKA